MDDFLFYIGWYNLLGPVVMVPMQRESVADAILRRATEIVAEPYRHGPFSRLWLWWATTTNAFLGAMMLLARHWPPNVQRPIVIGVLAVYAAMWLAVVARARKPKYGRGIAVVHALWIAQMAWAGWVLAG